MKKTPLNPALVCLSILFISAAIVSAQVTRSRSRQRMRTTPNRIKPLRGRMNPRNLQELERQFRPQIPENYAIRMALGVTEQQWKIIKPHFDKVEDLMAEARIGIGVIAFGGSSMSGGGGSAGGSGGFSSGGFGGSSAGGGSSGGFSTGSQNQGPYNQTTRKEQTRLNWQWARPSERKQTQTEGEKVCEELLDLLQDKQADPARVQEKMAALSRIRKKALRRLPQAQEALRKVLDDRQQAIMSVMGYLN